MANLYLKNVPKALYEALCARARERQRSIAAEVLFILKENIPTRKELKARQDLLRRLELMHSKPRIGHRSFPSTEKMQRMDRAR